MSMSYRGPVLTALYRFIIWPCEAALLFLAVGFIVIAGLGMAFQRNQTMQLYQHISSVTTASAPHVMKGLTALNALAKQAGGIAIEKIQGR